MCVDHGGVPLLNDYLAPRARDGDEAHRIIGSAAIALGSMVSNSEMGLQDCLEMVRRCRLNTSG